MENLIKTIQQIKTKEGKRYWIKALNVNNSVKGQLIVYFNLL